MTETINDIKAFIKKLEDKYPYSTDKTNYAQILSGVASRTKVHDIIKDIVTIAYETSKAPYFMSEYKQFLYGYMNDCIADLYKRRGETSLNSFCEAWINIRTHENKKATRERIEQIAKSRGLEVDKTIKDIRKIFHEFEHNYKMLKQFSYGTNGYNQYLPLSKKGAALLLNYKFDPYGLPYGLGWSSNIFTEVERERTKTVEQYLHERHLNERREYWRKVREEETASGVEAKKQKEKDPNSLSAWQIILIIIVGGLFGWLIAEAGSLLLLFALFIGALFLKCLR